MIENSTSLKRASSEQWVFPLGL